MVQCRDKNKIPALAPTYRFQWEEVQDCYVLLYPEGMIKLSSSAGEILKRCDGDNSIEQIINDLQRHFQNDSIENDVLNFMENAYGNGWIINKQ